MIVESIDELFVPGKTEIDESDTEFVFIELSVEESSAIFGKEEPDVDVLVISVTVVTVDADPGNDVRKDSSVVFPDITATDEESEPESVDEEEWFEVSSVIVVTDELESGNIREPASVFPVSMTTDVSGTVSVAFTTEFALSIISVDTSLVAEDDDSAVELPVIASHDDTDSGNVEESAVEISVIV